MRMDYSDWYARVSTPFRGEKSRRVLALVDNALVYAFAVVYGGMLVYLAFTSDARLLKTFLVPAATFALVTVVRAALNKPRPYEAFPIEALIRKDTQGKSMPSRHMSSAVVIAATAFWLWPAIGVVLFVLCCVIAFTRIVGGVHFPRDIVVATVIALACAVLGILL